MVAIKFLLAATAGSLVAAMPGPTPAAQLVERAVDCSKVTKCVKSLKKLGPPASAFCSSYLKVPAKQTKTITVTPAVVTSTTSTTTVYVTSSRCPPTQQKRNVPLDYLGFEYAEPVDTILSDLEKRGRGARVPPLLAPFGAARISEGCRCLGLRPKTTTTTTTRTAPAPTLKVLATQSRCVEFIPPEPTPPEPTPTPPEPTPTPPEPTPTPPEPTPTPPVCLPASLLSRCTRGDECCSGLCEFFLDRSSCCNDLGERCDLGNPGACCSKACRRELDQEYGLCF